MKRVLYRRFKSRATGVLLTKTRRPEESAAAFASMIGEQRLISISSENTHGQIVVTVWYWSHEYQRRLDDGVDIEKLSRYVVSAENHVW